MLSPCLLGSIRKFIARSHQLAACHAQHKDGVTSTASILIGIAAADLDRTALIIAGVAALVAGAVDGCRRVQLVSSQRHQRARHQARVSSSKTPEVELGAHPNLKNEARPAARAAVAIS
jgi:hypothetical protein